jgi:osmotically-inducible protein OsmY
MSEWDPEREKYEPERDLRRDYPGRRRQDNQRGVWSIGGDPRGPECGAHAGKGPRNYRRSDQRIYEDVCETLTRDGGVDATDVEVNVSDGEVMLLGSVCDGDMNRRAEALTTSCPGVRRVRNQLEVKTPPR